MVLSSSKRLLAISLITLALMLVLAAGVYFSVFKNNGDELPDVENDVLTSNARDVLRQGECSEEVISEIDVKSNDNITNEEHAQLLEDSANCNVQLSNYSEASENMKSAAILYQELGDTIKADSLNETAERIKDYPSEPEIIEKDIEDDGVYSN